MAMKDYKVTHEDGEVTYYQFDDSDEVGKAGLQALKDAAKDQNNTVKSVDEGTPKPINAGSSK